MRFGKKLEQRRIQLRITQSDLARTVGVTRQTVYRWETDTTRPPEEKFLLICRALGVTAEYFCSDVAASVPEYDIAVEKPEVAVENGQKRVSKKTSFGL